MIHNIITNAFSLISSRRLMATFSCLTMPLKPPGKELSDCFNLSPEACDRAKVLQRYAVSRGLGFWSLRITLRPIGFTFDSLAEACSYARNLPHPKTLVFVATNRKLADSLRRIEPHMTEINHPLWVNAYAFSPAADYMGYLSQAAKSFAGHQSALSVPAN